MLDRAQAIEVLDRAIASAGTEICVPPNTDPAQVEASIRSNLCDPFEVRARVMAPGFPFAAVGEEVSGVCVAHASGYWLVYQEPEARFLCFWGEAPGNLGAHGVFGNPLYCWSA